MRVIMPPSYLRSRVARVLTSVLLTGIASLQCGLARAAPEVEVLHWWSRGGDNVALQVFKDEFKYRGGVWHDVATDTSVDALNIAMSRMAKGYSPTLVHWNAGWEVNSISRIGLSEPVTAQRQHLENTILNSVLEMVSVDEQIVAIPVNVHSENWLWYRYDRVNAASSAAFADWPQFLNFARARKAAGETVLAVGSEPWQQRLLFNNVLLGVAGPSVYRRFYVNRDRSVIREPGFRQALSIFRSLQQYSKAFANGKWDEQVAAVANGEALTVSMGDWAKGEFQNLGLNAGDDLACIPSPSTQNTLILVLDVFVRGRVHTEEEKQGQELFIEVVTDRIVNQRFNHLKGSLSPLKYTDLSDLDVCSKATQQRR